MINSNAQLEMGAMALIKMLRGGMFTLPAATRRKLGLKDGDYVQAVEVEEGVLLKPVTLVRACPQLSQMMADARWMAARKCTARLS